MDIFDKVCEIIRDNMQLDDRTAFSADMTFEEMELDSLDVVDTVMAIEESFDITISDEELDEVKTLGDLIEIIKEKKGI